MEILGTELVCRMPFISLFKKRYKHNDKEGDWYFASRKTKAEFTGSGMDAVIIVPVIEGPTLQLLTLREYRVPIEDWEHGFAAGLANVGESAEEAARRELLEETGYEITKITSVSPLLFTSSGLTDEATRIVFCKCIKKCEPKLEESEEIQMQFLNPKDISDLLESAAVGRVKIAAKAWGIFLMYDQLEKQKRGLREKFKHSC